MKDPVTYRLYRPGDEIALLELYRQVFELDVSVETWRWVHRDAPEGPTVIVVAENISGIIGAYHVQPRPFWLRGRRCLAGLPIWTMVHPAHRNLTILVEIATRSYQLCREQGMEFLYVFARDAIHRVRQAVLGWQVLPRIVEWDGPFQPQAARFGGDLPVWRGLTLEQAEPLTLVLPPAPEGTVAGVRSARWLRWRYCEKPGGEYALFFRGSPERSEGYVALKPYDRDGARYGHILDWQPGSAEPEAAEALLSAAWEQFRAWGVERVSCWSFPGSALHDYLAPRGLTANGRETNFAWLGLSSGTEGALASMDRWNLHMADSDIY